jgi:hypothetical protein
VALTITTLLAMSTTTSSINSSLPPVAYTKVKSTTSPEAEFLDEIQTKVLKVFLLAIQSHLYSFALRFLFLQTHATFYNFFSALLYTIKEKGGNLLENHTHFPKV